MADSSFETIDRQGLELRLRQERPDNEHRSRGFALVNVLGREQFEQEHIPGSINIPGDRIEEFEQRFDKDKDIVVYCASLECDASPTVAEELAKRGFTSVFDYERGLSDWKHAGDPVEGTKAA